MPHAKTDSDVTSLAASSPPRSPRRPAYYVMSPSPADPEKFSLAGSTPGGSPIHHFHKPRYLNSPIHHSRESTTGLSFSLKHGAGPWRKLSQGAESGGLGGDETEEEGMEREEASPVRCYACALLCFVLFFTVFSLILWGASKAYKPVILVKVRSVRSSSPPPLHSPSLELLHFHPSISSYLHNMLYSTPVFFPENAHVSPSCTVALFSQKSRLKDRNVITILRNQLDLKMVFLCEAERGFREL